MGVKWNGEISVTKQWWGEGAIDTPQAVQDPVEYFMRGGGGLPAGFKLRNRKRWRESAARDFRCSVKPDLEPPSIPLLSLRYRRRNKHVQLAGARSYVASFKIRYYSRCYVYKHVSPHPGQKSPHCCCSPLLHPSANGFEWTEPTKYVTTTVRMTHISKTVRLLGGCGRISGSGPPF